MASDSSEGNSTSSAASPIASDVAPIGDLIQARISRRGMLQTVVGMTAAGTWVADWTSPVAAADGALVGSKSPGSTLQFNEVPHGIDPKVHVPPGHRAAVLLRWGDRVLPGAPEFDFKRQTVAAQLQQFGYNNDFVAYLPLPLGSSSSDHGLLVVNHEYTTAELMFAGLSLNRTEPLSREQVQIEQAAHGLTVIEIRRGQQGWETITQSKLNRRISALKTEMELTGPVRGHNRVKTSADPAGTTVLGTLNNCAGGVTPWGTVLSGEENFNQYFKGKLGDERELAAYQRYGVGESAVSDFDWYRYDDRFDVGREPHEPNRFGWVVEFDPYDPQSLPKKRTALGRAKHEGAATALSADGRLVVYTGDDERFEHLYRFVTARQFDPHNRRANLDLLDEGTLSVARFEADGSVRWLPLVYGQGPLTATNGFHNQGDVLIETRRAAKLLGATPMDRPEDVEACPATGRVFVVLTNNTKREAEDIDPANPRPANKHGHILELSPPQQGGKPDHAGDAFQWSVFLLAGNPAQAADGAQYHEETSSNGWLSSPDNCTFDNRGRIWIATDGAPKSADMADGVYACDTTGPGRALTKLFLRAPCGAEVCGPCFTPDNSTLFVSIQHPGEGSTCDAPDTRWPDFDPQLPPRPAVVAIMRKDHGPLGD